MHLTFVEVLMMVNTITKYNGELKDNLYHGQGTLYYEDGKIEYQGEWKCGLKYGLGTQYFTNGSVHYEGEWKDGLYHGQGILYDRIGKVSFKGVWKDGRPFFYGKYNDADSLYMVEIDVGNPVNYEYIRNSSGVKYHGEVKNGIQNGYGTQYFEEGKIEYQGEWKDGLQKGIGAGWMFDKIWYFGEWKDGLSHGYGTQFDAEGNIVFSGNWDNEDAMYYDMNFDD